MGENGCGERSHAEDSCQQRKFSGSASGSEPSGAILKGSKQSSKISQQATAFSGPKRVRNLVRQKDGQERQQHQEENVVASSRHGNHDFRERDKEQNSSSDDEASHPGRACVLVGQ